MQLVVALCSLQEIKVQNELSPCATFTLTFVGLTLVRECILPSQNSREREPLCVFMDYGNCLHASFAILLISPAPNLSLAWPHQAALVIYLVAMKIKAS